MPKAYENPLRPEAKETPYEAAKKPKNESQFYDQVGSGAKALTAVPADMLGGNTRLFFRSDDRPTREIFADGFSARDDQGIVYRLMKQDIHPHTAVCVTGSLNAAALFPVKVDRSRSADIDPSQKDAPEETRVYVVAPKALFDTHDVQARFAARIVRDQGAEQQVMALNNLHGQERAAPRIDAEDVLCAFTVKRTWSGADYTAGGTFTITDFERNPAASQRHTKALEDFFAELKAHGEIQPLSTSQDIAPSSRALVEQYVASGNPHAPAERAPLPDALVADIAESMRDARKLAGERAKSDITAWRKWKDEVSDPDQGIGEDMPVTVRRIDDRNTFMAEIERFELRMGRIDAVGSHARQKLYDNGENSEDARGYVAYKGDDVVVGWMTLVPGERAHRIEKICSDIDPVHARDVGQALVVQAVAESHAAGNQGNLDIDRRDTLKLAGADVDLFRHMGFHMREDGGALFPFGRRDGFPRWEEEMVESGRHNKRGEPMMMVSRHLFRENEALTVAPVASDELLRPILRDPPAPAEGPQADGLPLHPLHRDALLVLEPLRARFGLDEEAFRNTAAFTAQAAGREGMRGIAHMDVGESGLFRVFDGQRSCTCDIAEARATPADQSLMRLPDSSEPRVAMSSGSSGSSRHI
jgi:hypothetical protein